MPVQIGQKHEHGFNEPVGMLGDCHRRIERFLSVLVRLSNESAGAPLEPAQRDSLEAALRYFDQAAPKHTADEEDSLFPRLRAIADPRVAEVLAEMDRLEQEHRTVEPLHAEAAVLGRRWISQGLLAAPDAARLAAIANRLAEAYQAHIAYEDGRLFPLAAEVLPASAQIEIGNEMAARRNVRP